MGFTAKTQQIGSWRMHINYNNVLKLVSAPNIIMGATEKSVFLYDIADNSTKTLDKASGLSDFGVQDIAYDSTFNTFIIAYTNSNIDLFKDHTIINIPDIKTKLTSSSKNINGIYTNNGFAYISTDFGIVVLDIENEEIDNTYVIGSTGDQVKVTDCTIVQDTIFALTAQGLKKASISSGNLLDYSQWNHAVPYISGLKEIESFNDTLYGISNELAFYQNGVWQTIYSDTLPLKNLKASEVLTFIKGLNIYSVQNGIIDTLNTSFLIDPQVCIKTQNNIYMGDKKLGIYKNGQKIGIANNPFTNIGFNAVSYNNSMAITSGGINSNVDGMDNVEGGFYIFEEGIWYNYNIYTFIPTDFPIQEFTRIAYNKYENKLYVGMFTGLLVSDFATGKVYNSSNSPIAAALLNPGVQKVTGLAVDSKGNTWVLNPETHNALKVKTPNDEWYSFSIGNDNQKMVDLLIDDSEQKWVAQNGQGIIVYKEGENLSASGEQKITLTTNGNQGNLPNNSVLSMALDKSGEVWVGTAQGIAVFSCPSRIFDATSSCRVSDRITSTLDQYTEYLFETDRVSAIEVDGANRKWIGTSAGIFLMSEDGKEQILSFNAENSPLPNNEIYDITVDKTSGEVFIFTSGGMVSYMGDATEPAENYENIKAYPNPVRPEYTGPISIDGLISDSYVKITDTHGVLIKEGYALGGKFVWDGNDMNGKRARTGIYYVFSGSTVKDVKEKAKTSIAIIR